MLLIVSVRSGSSVEEMRSDVNNALDKLDGHRHPHQFLPFRRNDFSEEQPERHWN